MVVLEEVQSGQTPVDELELLVLDEDHPTQVEEAAGVVLQTWLEVTVVAHQSGQTAVEVALALLELEVQSGQTAVEVALTLEELELQSGQTTVEVALALLELEVQSGQTAVDEALLEVVEDQPSHSDEEEALVVVVEEVHEAQVADGLVVVVEEDHGSQRLSAAAKVAKLATAMIVDFILIFGVFGWSRKSDCGQRLLARKSD